MLKRNKIALATGLALLASAANAGYTFKLNEQDSITFGGFIKIDTRYVDGDVAYQDFWTGGGTPLAEDASKVKMFANESRFNMKFVHGEVTGFLEMDFYGGGGNEIISNSSHPRLRHATIKYQNMTFGQTWTTFMNTSSLAETADFAGPMVGTSFVRNTMVRYTNGGLQLAIENPESWGNDGIDGTPDADSANDDLPDFIAKYSFKGDWGNVSVSGLVRQLNTTDDDTESAVGVAVAGKIKTFGKDDFRFSVSTGNLGRYVGVTAATDIYNGEVEESTSYLLAYRHFWTEDTRSSVFIGNTTTEESDRDRSHYGVNVFKNYTPELSFGVELGSYDMDDDNVDASSMYAQFSAKYVL
ncbi:DcaP family trimeric outer membrane transporter [Thalassotalea psychrophila]|uniref:DcaP family trimeric outer membrane transporter n=1 Tax=Thalassotalea psychrophila TaxID=3065647 RepID=A0ABY9TUD6_9GAMM|nr:DcaP family trimeric outer membrane transporter [Colwelliaceae bacterium SQ149]